MNTIPILKTFADKNLKGKICLSPYKSLSIDIDGGAWLCMCQDWGNQYIGNILTTNLENLLSNAQAQQIRKSILEGNYRYCNEHKCGILQSNGLVDFEKLAPIDQALVSDPENYNTPLEIFLALDKTCNLSCPSCRTEIIKPSEDQIELQKQIGEVLYQNLFSRPSDKFISLRLSSSGEVFSSPMLLGFLKKITTDDFPNLELWFQTNGLLAPSRWQQIQHLEKNIKNITVTIDSPQPDTYEKLRRGGKWPNLLDAMSFLKDKKDSCNFSLHTRMVVQKDNYFQMPDFYNFSKNYHADIVEYTRIIDWGTYSNGEFKNVDVFSQSHQNYTEAREILNNLIHYPDVRTSGGL